MALLILALLQRIFLMSSLMLLLVWLIFFMVLIKLLPILGTISRSEERFSRNAETDLVCRLLLEKKISNLSLYFALTNCFQESLAGLNIRSMERTKCFDTDYGYV